MVLNLRIYISYFQALQDASPPCCSSNCLCAKYNKITSVINTMASHLLAADKRLGWNSCGDPIHCFSLLLLFSYFSYFEKVDLKVPLNAPFFFYFLNSHMFLSTLVKKKVCAFEGSYSAGSVTSLAIRDMSWSQKFHSIKVPPSPPPRVNQIFHRTVVRSLSSTNLICCITGVIA